MKFVPDSLQKFIFCDSDTRGEMVHLNESYQTILTQYQYLPKIQQLLGECLIATILLAATIKFQGQLTLQFKGEGPVALLVAKCDHQFNIRALARFDEEKIPEQSSAQDLIREGSLIVTIQNDATLKTYQSIIAIQQQTIASCLESYFGQSEQLPTKIWLSVNEETAAGMLLQLLPNDSTTRDREIFWEHAIKMGETLTDQELLELDNPTLLHRLYHDQDIELYQPTSIQFKCTCTLDRMKNAILLFGEVEVHAILAEKPTVVVTCEFCNKHYDFDRADITEIFKQAN